MTPRYEPVESPDSTTTFEYHDLTPPTLTDVYAARWTLSQYLPRTPLVRSETLSSEFDAEVLVEEHGKTKTEAMGEIRRGIENVEVACGVPSLMQAGTCRTPRPKSTRPQYANHWGYSPRSHPFNFPAMIPLWFLPYAVATGNTFVLKPSEKTPLTAKYIFELLDETGFPDGVVTLINGSVDTVTALLEHEDIEGISFVGSTPVAKHIYETAAAHGKRVQAQGGAKNHTVVSDSADLDFAVEQTVSSAFANSGQRCLTNPSAVVHDDIYDEFADRQATLHEQRVPGTHHIDIEFTEYLYRPLSVTYPVLSDITDLTETLRTARDTVDETLASRGDSRLRLSPNSP